MAEVGKEGTVQQSDSNYRAGELGNGRQVEVNQRRQDKVIAALVRGDSHILGQETTTVTEAERGTFLRRIQERRIGEGELRQVLAGVRGEVGRERDDEELRRVHERFEGETEDKVRMRRIVALGTQGTMRPDRGDGVSLGDLHRFVNEQVGDAVAYEAMIPRILREVGEQGVDTYLPIINEVGRALYGSQWIYLEQFRLAEREASRDGARNEATIAEELRVTQGARGARGLLEAVAHGEIVPISLDSRLETFHQIERGLLPDVPSPRYTIDQLRDSTSQHDLGDYIICEDRRLDREGLGNVIAGYNKHTGEVMAFKLSDASAESDRAITNENFVRGLENPLFFTYESRMTNGDQIIRAYPLVSTDLEGYIENNGALTQRQALSTVIQIGEGLRELHRRGRGHLDVAAANIFVDSGGRVHLADFDALTSQSEIDNGVPIFAGNIFIKPAEVYEERAIPLADVDIYSLTTLLYQSMTGETAFFHTIPTTPGVDREERRRQWREQVLAAHKTGELRLLDGVPADIQRIIRKGVDPDQTRRYQSMDEMLSDLLDAYAASAEDASESHLFRQPRLIQTPERSPRILANPETVLDPSRERHDYLERQDPEYLRQLRELNAEIGRPMHEDTQAAVCIPVAGHQEGGNIYNTLEGFAHQTLGHNQYEVVLLVNTSERVNASKQAEIAETLSEIERAKRDFPDLAVSVANIVVPNSQINIWNLRKIVTDLAVLRADQSGLNHDLLLLSNDADNQGVSEHYLQGYVDYFVQNPEKEGAVGNLQFDPKAFVRFPELSIATQLSTRLDQHGFRNGNVMLFGANSVMKDSIYSAIGGYPSTLVENTGGEQGWTGKSIRELRKTRRTLGFTEDALLTTSSRRQVLRYLEDPARVITFGDVDTEERMRSLDYTAFPVFNWDDITAATQMQQAITNRVNHIIGLYERGEHLGKDSGYYRNNLEALGIRYRVEGDPKDLDSRIVITDMGEFVRRQNAMQRALARGETNMATVYELAA